MSGTTGPYILADDPIEINAGRRTVTLSVANTGDRAIQVGSHFHFFETNRALRFDRAVSFGMRLNIPAGTAARFEPGARRDVLLVELGGSKRVTGLNGLTNGSVNSIEVRARAVDAAMRRGFSINVGHSTATEADRGSN